MKNTDTSTEEENHNESTDPLLVGSGRFVLVVNIHLLAILIVLFVGVAVEIHLRKLFVGGKLVIAPHLVAIRLELGVAHALEFVRYSPIHPVPSCWKRHTAIAVARPEDGRIFVENSRIKPVERDFAR